MVSPTAPSIISTLNRSPSETLYCFPPVLITAYIVDILLLKSLHTADAGIAPQRRTITTPPDPVKKFAVKNFHLRGTLRIVRIFSRLSSPQNSFFSTCVLNFPLPNHH